MCSIAEKRYFQVPDKVITPTHKVITPTHTSRSVVKNQSKYLRDTVPLFIALCV